ncbi:MAG: hypothetical protein II840_03585 [Kiritimatiellae bacterium]|nr:hypothetical protein [Kiritimatiellia bacterium]
MKRNKCPYPAARRWLARKIINLITTRLSWDAFDSKMVSGLVYRCGRQDPCITYLYETFWFLSDPDLHGRTAWMRNITVRQVYNSQLFLHSSEFAYSKMVGPFWPFPSEQSFRTAECSKGMAITEILLASGIIRSGNEIQTMSDCTLEHLSSCRG